MSFLLIISTLHVVTTTSDINCVARKLASQDIKVYSIVPGGMCPGHFDLSPDEANIIASSELILSHGWESWIKKVKDINPGVQIVDLKTDGNWMIPSVYLQGALEIHEIFRIEYEKKDKDTIPLNENLKNLKEEVSSLKKLFHKECKDFREKKVFCNVHLKEFLDSLGFNVAGNFSPGTDVTVNEMVELLENPEVDEVVLVVDNLQSGKKFGKLIAEEIGANHAVISNFPRDNCYRETLIYNIEILKRALIDKDKESE